ncbi:MAG TPA: hypothetical protein VKF39_03855 [Nitrososphaerales archaeon]|nr:hypothetical protein [Nitrososphaerales archaeon]
MTPKQKLIIALPIIAVLVIILVYFQLFANPFVIVAIFVLYVAVSLWNKRKFNRQKEEAEAKGRPKARSDAIV